MTREILLRVPSPEGTLSIPAEVIYSRRRTAGLEVTAGGRVKVRVPLRTGDRAIEDMVRTRAAWLREKYLLALARQERREAAGEKDYERDPALEAGYRKQAAEALRRRTAYFAARMGVTYGRITIRAQKTRWGSCSSRGNLNFNWKLIKMPAEILDYVVVHELAHRKYMDHSPRFWAEVEQVLPDYRARRQWLKEYGGDI